MNKNYHICSKLSPFLCELGKRDCVQINYPNLHVIFKAEGNAVLHVKL